MQSLSSLATSPSMSVEEGGSLALSREFALGTERAAAGPAKRRQRGPRPSGEPTGAAAPTKRMRVPGEGDVSSTAGASSVATEGEEERWRVLQQLSQVLPAAGSLLPDRDLSDEGPLLRSGCSAANDALDWEACNRALDRLVAANKPQESFSTGLGVASSSSTGDMGLFDIPLGASNDILDVRNDHFDAGSNDPLASLTGGPSGCSLLSLKEEITGRRSSSNAADPMKERQRRDLQQRTTLDLASQIISRFRGARRPGVLQLLHRFFSCSSRQVRDPQELEKLVGACCYIIARQQGEDMSLNDVTAQLEKRHGAKGKQRCRCISRWVVKVCGKLRLRCLPRHRDAEVMASNALKRICCHLKLLLTQQEQQELLLLQHLKEAYRQCLQHDAADALGSNSSNTNQQQQQQDAAALAELDDEELLRLLLMQQQEESAASAAASASPGGGADSSQGGDGLPDVEAFLKQFDFDSNAKKTQVEDETWQDRTAAPDSIVSLAPDGSLQMGLVAAGSGSKRAGVASERGPRGGFEEPLFGEEPADPAALDAQIQQHECVLRLLRLLPSAQRIKLDHSIWLQKQRKMALQQLCEQSSVVIKCVGLLQQLSAVAFAAAAKKRGYQPGAVLQAAAAAAAEGSRRDADSGEGSESGVPVEGEDPLDEHWRACGRCDAISTAAHFVIVFECLQVPVFQRVVLEALEVDRRSVYKRRREQLHLAINIFRRLPGAENVTLKNLGPYLVTAVNDPKITKELLQIAKAEPLPASAADCLDCLTDEKQSSTSGQTSGQTSCHFSSQTASRSSGEELSTRGGNSTRGLNPVGGPSLAPARAPPAQRGNRVNPKGLCDAETISSAAAAAALKELEEGDPVLAETPMARVVSLQYERTQQRWVCKWREGVGTGGRWHRRCFSVVKYGEDGAHTLAAAVAKKLRDRRNQEVNGTKQSSTPTSEGTPVMGDVPTSIAGSKRGARGAALADGAASDSVYHGPAGPAKARNKRSAAAATATIAAAPSQDAGPSYSFYDTSESQTDALLATLPADPNLSSVVASAAYSDEMERLAQLLQKARSNPLLAKWLDERAPPPGPAALRAAAESLVPYLALQTAAGNKSPAAAASPFGTQQQPLHRRGRVAGAREGM